MWKSSSLLIAAVLLGGCKALVPYDSKFACEGTQDYGRCMDVSTAYEDALSTSDDVQRRDKSGKDAPKWDYRGTNAKSAITSPTLQRKRTTTAKGTQIAFVPRTTEEMYRQSQYRELAGLIEEPVTPIVQPPKVLRTLIVSYSAGDSLYMPRFVYYLADEAKFVLGDYLRGEGAVKTVYPNATPIAKVNKSE
jgi:conjugal transfer pilus assembly protein TraV